MVSLLLITTLVFTLNFKDALREHCHLDAKDRSNLSLFSKQIAFYVEFSQEFFLY